jgi:sortase B
VLAGVVMIAVGAVSIAGVTLAQARYEDLARSAAVTEAITDTPGIAWDELERQNPEICAWVSVAGTSIDYPVAKRDQSFYLTHDAWGHESSVGCPFVDEHCEPDDAHVLVYAHHVAGTTAMFSELSQTTTQSGFDEIIGCQACLWSTRAGTVRLRPLCTVVVDKSDQDIQRKRFAAAQDVRLWLREQLARSCARSADAEQLVDTATRCVSCVTCASDVGGQRERAVVLFVDGSA